jgi:hypothetical protein
LREPAESDAPRRQRRTARNGRRIFLAQPTAAPRPGDADAVPPHRSGQDGSSFLQAAFAALAGALLEAGIRYPADAGGHERALSGGITSGNGVLLTETLAGEERLAALLA